MADVSAFKTLATSLIGDNGQQVTIRRLTDGSNPTAPWKPGTPNQDNETVFATVFQIEDEKVDGTLVQRGDRLVLISAADVTGGIPTTQDFILIGGKQNKVISVENVSPSGDNVLYKVLVRE